MTKHIYESRTARLESLAEQQAEFSQVLNALREEFHSTGRFDDSNSKLDEITKLLITKFHEENRRLEGKPYRFSQEYLRGIARRKFGDDNSTAEAIKHLFNEIAEDPLYLNPDGTSVFGSHKTLNIQPTDNEFARKIVELLNSVELLHLDLNDTSTTREIRYDILNEVFGHFVRDTFRNTKEDAQYMTPPEAVNAMVDIAFTDIAHDPQSFDRLLGKGNSEPFIILDPTCGVGSLLVAALSKANQLIDKHVHDEDDRRRIKFSLRKASIWGQDKVDRMVRLAKLNLLLFGGNHESIVQGNSIIGESLLDRLDGKVDLILTNPPFGAKFELDDLFPNLGSKRYPMLWDCFVSPKNISSQAKRTKRKITSEIALLDRCLNILRPDGRLLIVLPDNIASGAGIYSDIRQWIGSHAVVKAVLQLPPVAFAQAGTRTKTCIVYIQKQDYLRHSKKRFIFMALCRDVGYDVVNRLGTPTKRPNGQNQLIDIVCSYIKSVPEESSVKPPYISSEEPPAVWISPDSLINGRWSPGFYSPGRVNAIQTIQSLPSDLIHVVRLEDVAEVMSRRRRSEPVSDTTKCISVLHVGGDGTISFHEVEKYNPKYPGTVCREGDVLFSKINPYILRCCVVPERPYKLTCSGEFEILRPRKNYGPYVLAALLRLPVVRDQVTALTTGTSSSHARIKSSELREVVLPMPRSMKLLKTLEEHLAETTIGKYRSEDTLQALQGSLAGFMDKEIRELEFLASLSETKGLDKSSMKDSFDDSPYQEMLPGLLT